MVVKDRPQAVAYLRTSSASNVDGDSADRQRAAIKAYAKRAGVEVVAEFYDAAVSGADHIQDRAGFADMLARIEGNGVRLVLVEDPSRFARSVLAQEAGLAVLQRLGVRVVTASGEDLTETDDPGRIAMRQMAGVFAEFEKNRLVHKLRGARDRASAVAGHRVEGRKPVIVGEAEVALRRLARRNPRTGKRRSLRQIAAEMAVEGYAAASGKPFGAQLINDTLARLGIGTDA